MAAGGKHAAVNAATATLVPIHIKTGFGGKSKFPGLEALSGASGTFNVNSTWADIFQTHFGVTIDSARYSVQREARTTIVKHDPREQIKVLLKEFKQNRTHFNVFVIQNKRLRNDEEGEVVRTPPVPPQTWTTTNSTNPIIPNKIHKRVVPKVKDTGNKLTPQNATSRNSSTATGFSHSFPEKRVDSLIPLNRYSQQRSPNRGSVQIEERHTFIRDTYPLPVINSVRSLAPLAPQPPRQQPRSVPINGPPGLNREDQYNINRVDDDAQSNHSNASQDSQVEDLREMGIIDEDIKSTICRKARNNYSNVQLLKLKHEMEQFKKKNSRRWVRWTMTAPITTHIFRELFSID